MKLIRLHRNILLSMDTSKFIVYLSFTTILSIGLAIFLKIFTKKELVYFLSPVFFLFFSAVGALVLAIKKERIKTEDSFFITINNFEIIIIFSVFSEFLFSIFYIFTKSSLTVYIPLIITLVNALIFALLSHKKQIEEVTQKSIHSVIKRSDEGKAVIYSFLIFIIERSLFVLFLFGLLKTIQSFLYIEKGVKIYILEDSHIITILIIFIIMSIFKFFFKEYDEYDKILKDELNDASKLIGAIFNGVMRENPDKPFQILINYCYSNKESSRLYNILYSIFGQRGKERIYSGLNILREKVDPRTLRILEPLIANIDIDISNFRKLIVNLKEVADENVFSMTELIRSAKNSFGSITFMTILISSIGLALTLGMADLFSENIAKMGISGGGGLLSNIDPTRVKIYHILSITYLLPVSITISFLYFPIKKDIRAIVVKSISIFFWLVIIFIIVYSLAKYVLLKML